MIVKIVNTECEDYNKEFKLKSGINKLIKFIVSALV